MLKRMKRRHFKTERYAPGTHLADLGGGQLHSPCRVSVVCCLSKRKFSNCTLILARDKPNAIIHSVAKSAHHFGRVHNPFLLLLLLSQAMPARNSASGSSPKISNCTLPSTDSRYSGRPRALEAIRCYACHLMRLRWRLPRLH